MILYKPTGQTFKNRKEAKKHFGATFYHKIEKENTDILYINDIQFATNELHNDNQTNYGIQKQ